MSDPLNPHGIAGLRKGAYYRFTLLQIIQSMLAGADAAFGRDTAEQIEYARELYLGAALLVGRLQQRRSTVRKWLNSRG